MPLTTTTQPAKTTNLPGLPRKPLDIDKQQEAIRRVQDQTENRIKLGLRLFKAAQEHTSQRRSVLDQIKADQQALRDELQNDMAKSLQHYEHRVENFDNKLTETIDVLGKRINQLQQEFTSAENRIESLLQRAEELFNSDSPAKSPSVQQPVSVSASSAQPPVTENETQIFTRVIRRLDEQEPGTPIPPQPTN